MPPSFSELLVIDEDDQLLFLNGFPKKVINPPGRGDGDLVVIPAAASGRIVPIPVTDSRVSVVTAVRDSARVVAGSESRGATVVVSNRAGVKVVIKERG